MTSEKYVAKPCPFCGAKPIYRIVPFSGYHVADFEHAYGCYFSHSDMRYDSVGELMLELWNRRE